MAKKHIGFLLLSVLIQFSVAQASTPKLVKLWQTEAVLDVPESVLFDKKRKRLYTSNITGMNPWENDGKGSIGLVGLDGKVIEAEWITGLNGPKGMGLKDNILYVTDIDDIVLIDVDKAQIIKRYSVPDAGNINDLSVGDNGIVYFTDSKFATIYTLIGDNISVLHKGGTKFNGVLYSKGELLFVDNGTLNILHDDGSVTQVAKGMEGVTDGIERIDKDSWLVSCWRGTVYHVTRKGKVTLLLDGRPTETSAADLGYDPVNKIAYFPGFFKNFVVAYQLSL